jgi:hypothetical protein
MTFTLDELETEKFINWKKSLPKAPADVFGEEFQFTFQFHPTGLGVTKIIVREIDGEQIDVTNYDNW